MIINLDTKIENINKVGAATARRLNNLGIEKVRDLLFYFPFRYDDFSQKGEIKKLEAGQTVNIVGHIELIQNKKSPRKKMNITEALINDGNDSIKIIWFNQPFITRQLKVGDEISVAGKIENDFSGLIIKSPSYEKITNSQAIHTKGLVPVYNLTNNLTQKQIRFLIKQVLPLSVKITEWIPDEIIKSQKLVTLEDAIDKMHSPKNETDIEEAKKRLAFGEVFLLQIGSQLSKKNLENFPAITSKFKEKEIKKFVEELPFSLTDDQRKASWQLIQDTEKASPMTRLLEGDVGSGKTVVAVMGMLNAALNNNQSVLMVPTEILAVQHFESIKKILKKFDVNITLLTRTKALNNKNESLNKKSILDDIKNNKTNIIIGTHSLIQEKIEFNKLALVIIDEQHRFGVEQRKMLLEKSNNHSPHLLSMTATPIPRSLALALYGDLNLSVIKQMPKGRKAIITKVVSEKNREQAYLFIKNQIKEGRQVFVICPLIDVSDKLGVKSVKEEFKKLNEIIFPDIKIEMLHGKLKTKEKDEIMKNFLNKKTKILVSTSVIEVGVDVPNASIMIIEGSDRFGLAQLHQFRGRVGRGEHQSYCFLFTDSKSEKTKERLEAMEKYNDGFSLSKIDLKFRGPGEVYGTSQKGFPELKIASLFDYELINSAREEAIKIFENNKNLEKYPILKEELKLAQKVSRLE